MIYVLLQEKATKARRISYAEAWDRYSDQIHKNGNQQNPDIYAEEVLKDIKSIGTVLDISGDYSGVTMLAIVEAFGDYS
jgi:hypothetical protein